MNRGFTPDSGRVVFFSGETRCSIEQTQTRYARREAIRWGIALKGENSMIGSCHFNNFDAGFHRAETGYELNRAFWRQGLMIEALSAILSYGFTELGLHHVEAIIDIANEPSKKLLMQKIVIKDLQEAYNG